LIGVLVGDERGNADGKASIWASRMAAHRCWPSTMTCVRFLGSLIAVELGVGVAPDAGDGGDLMDELAVDGEGVEATGWPCRISRTGRRSTAGWCSADAVARARVTCRPFPVGHANVAQTRTGCGTRDVCSCGTPGIGRSHHPEEDPTWISSSTCSRSSPGSCQAVRSVATSSMVTWRSPRFRSAQLRGWPLGYLCRPL
jgi:hypothetical protein